MTVTVNRITGKAIEISVDGTLEKQDYREFVPAVDACIGKYGKADLLVRLPDPLRMSPGAVWEDLKFGVSHFREIDRLAIVGDDSGKAWLASVARPFVRSDARFFESSDIDHARNWLQSPESQL